MKMTIDADLDPHERSRIRFRTIETAARDANAMKSEIRNYGHCFTPTEIKKLKHLAKLNDEISKWDFQD